MVGQRFWEGDDRCVAVVFRVVAKLVRGIDEFRVKWRVIRGHMDDGVRR